MKQSFLIFASLLVVLVLPFLFRKEAPVIANPDARIVIITPHNESIRYEFAQAFQDWYQKTYGKTVYVDYRVIGGTSEIAQFLQSQYTNAFRLHWEQKLGKSWNQEVQSAFANRKLPKDASPLENEARQAFLASKVSSGMDLFWGGGQYDFYVQAGMGTLVDAGLLQSHPDWFIQNAEPGMLPDAIPSEFAGEQYYDTQGRWYGVCLSSFGIIYNRLALDALGIAQHPRQWEDLLDPRYFGQLAVSDPTKSGSMTKAFEMIIQQQMQLAYAEYSDAMAAAEPAQRSALEEAALAEGWMRGMHVIQGISANARYFTDSSQKVNIDVATGDCAAGMAIDFYGRFQQESILRRGGTDRFAFHLPIGGTTLSADPIGLLRGAPNRDVAIDFMEFVLSEAGQKLWGYRLDTPGGPQQYALRRMPIRPELYMPEHLPYLSDPEVIPYIEARHFTYQGRWTGRYFSHIRVIIRMAFMDTRKELVHAWRAILDARAEGRDADAAAAWAVFRNLDRISYAETATYIDQALKAPPIEEVRLSRELSAHFRNQYREAERLARGK